jgi:protein-L-isoaspartate(D-aspartate) O-methyltransferase
MRRFYAEEVMAVAGIDDARLLEAFATVRREDFLGPGPWRIVRFGDGAAREYRVTPDDDPKHILHNVVVAIDPARQLNNGQPSSLAMWIHSLRIAPGDSVLHIGCGVGYYTAIIAQLAARVVGIEYDGELAARAKKNVPGAEIHQGDGSDTHGVYDAIFVNAGATHPRAEWLAALKPGGRLVVPITLAIPGQPFAAGLMLEICGEEARFTTPVQIYDCAGARDAKLEPLLKPVLFGGKWREVRRLRRDAHDAGDACVLHAAGFCLAK